MRLGNALPAALLFSRGGFAERWQAVQSATEERRDLEGALPVDHQS